MSGSNQSALISTLKWFKLIDDAGAHGEFLAALVKAATDDKAGEVLKANLPLAYTFMGDGSIDVGRATGAQLEEKFRAYGLTGETVSKAMSFFIAACKEAGIPISAHIRLPKIVRNSSATKAKKARASSSDEADDGGDDDDEDADGGAGQVMRFEIPIPINRKVKISIPADFDDADWTLLQAMFTAYINRWKSIKNGGTE